MFAAACDKSRRDVVAERELQFRNQMLDGAGVPMGDLHDTRAPEFRKLEAASRKLAEAHFGCRVDPQVGTIRTLSEELRRRRPILQRHLTARHRSGDLSPAITKSIKIIRELRFKLLELNKVEGPLRVSAGIDPEKYGDQLIAATAATKAASVELNSVTHHLRASLGCEIRL